VSERFRHRPFGGNGATLLRKADPSKEKPILEVMTEAFPRTKWHGCQKFGALRPC